jgi:hypothetical protein
MTPSVPQFVTDEAQGRNDFINTQVIEGDLVSVDIVRNNNPVSGGQKAGTIRCSAIFKFQNIVELKREDGTEPDAKEWSVRYDYSEWDTSNARAMNPERRGDWFGFVVPNFKNAGIDLNDPLNDETGIESRINKRWRFELQSFERDYKIPLRDTGTNEVVYCDENSKEYALAIGEGQKTDDTGKMPIRIQAVYSNLFPTTVPSSGSSEEEVLARAAQLYAEFDAGASEKNMDAFKAAAIDDSIIADSMKVRKSIQSGKYNPNN